MECLASHPLALTRHILQQSQQDPTAFTPGEQAVRDMRNNILAPHTALLQQTSLPKAMESELLDTMRLCVDTSGVADAKKIPVFGYDGKLYAVFPDLDTAQQFNNKSLRANGIWTAQVRVMPQGYVTLSLPVDREEAKIKTLLQQLRGEGTPEPAPIHPQDHSQVTRQPASGNGTTAEPSEKIVALATDLAASRGISLSRALVYDGCLYFIANDSQQEPALSRLRRELEHAGLEPRRLFAGQIDNQNRIRFSVDIADNAAQMRFLDVAEALLKDTVHNNSGTTYHQKPWFHQDRPGRR